MLDGGAFGGTGVGAAEAAVCWYPWLAPRRLRGHSWGSLSSPCDPLGYEGCLGGGGAGLGTA